MFREIEKKKKEKLAKQKPKQKKPLKKQIKMPEIIDKSNKGHVASEAALGHVKV